MSSPQLKYKEVEKELRQLAKSYPPGARIPPERHLAITYDCSFLTVRKAMKALVDDGLIVRRVGSGSFVTGNIKGAAPEVAAGSRPKRKKNQIGLLVYQHGNAYAHKLLQSIAHTAMEIGVELRPAWVEQYGDNCLKQAQALKEEGCTALVLPWFPANMARDVVDFIRRSPLPVSIPLLIYGFEKNYFGLPEHFGDDLIVMTDATCDYLKELGNKQIAFLGPEIPDDFVLQKMLTAYTSFVSKHRIPSMSFLASSGTPPLDYVANLWKSHKGSLGVVCYDDEHALRFMTAMTKIGLHAPGDYAVIGHNDNEAGKFSDPPLTTIGHDFPHASEGLLRNALALAADRTEQTDSTPRPKLLIRGSCGGLGHINARIDSRLSPLFEVVEMDGAETP